MYTSNLTLKILALLNTLVLAMCASDIEVFGETLHRSRRQLLFPNSTMWQFNAGMSVPTPVKMITFNWAIQANFQMPWNRSQIPIDILEANNGYTGTAKKKRDIGALALPESDAGYENDARLYHFYKYVEDILNGYGQNGTTCILRALCQLAAEPLHTDEDDDLLYELATFILNPMNDITRNSNEERESLEYIQAYKRGLNSEDCSSLYSNCTITLVDMFTELRDVS